ncbi:hypothetical protein JCM3765_007102 [Sporobolomyces pararoseus]
MILTSSSCKDSCGAGTSTTNSKFTWFTALRTGFYSFSIGISIANLIICSFFINEVSNRLYGYYEPSVELIAASAISILVLSILHVGFHFRRRNYSGFISSLGFELIVLFILWCLFLGGAAAITSDLGPAFRNTRLCRQSKICSLGKTIQILSWIEWSSLTILLFIVGAVSLSGKGGNVWNRSTAEIVRDGHNSNYVRKGSTATEGGPSTRTSGEMTNV